MTDFTEAADYVFDKNEELYQRFSPDWASPPSDTIKDILEERGKKYENFVGDAVGWLDYVYSTDQVEDIFDGKLEMTASVALFLSEKLGSTEGFWLTRSADYRIQRELEDSKKLREVYLNKSKPLYGKLPTESLERILLQCLSAQVKMFDVPYSASSHLNFAIAALSELIPDYNPDDEEMRQALEWAISEGKILRGEE
jgi:plasmid maintenance system antidote protein VapI